MVPTTGPRTAAQAPPVSCAPPPRAAAGPAGYPVPSDITLVVIPEMAHMHNFADTRRRLWDRFYAWLTVLACLPTVAYPG